MTIQVVAALLALSAALPGEEAGDGGKCAEEHKRTGVWAIDCIKALVADRQRSLSSGKLAAELADTLRQNSVMKDCLADHKDLKCDSAYRHLPWIEYVVAIRVLAERGNRKYTSLMADVFSTYCHGPILVMPSDDLSICWEAANAWVKLSDVDPASDTGLRRIVAWSSFDTWSIEHHALMAEWVQYLDVRGWTPAAVAILKAPTPDFPRSYAMASVATAMGYVGLKAEVIEAVLSALNEHNTAGRRSAAAMLTEPPRMCIEPWRKPLQKFLARSDIDSDARATAEAALKGGDRECGVPRTFGNEAAHPR